MKGRARVLLIGGLSGVLVGLVGAWLYMGMLRSKGRSDRALARPADLMRLGVALVDVVRQVVALRQALTF